MNRTQIVRTSILMTCITGLGLCASFALQVIIAWLFGAGWEMDAYFVAIALPTFIMTLVNEAIGLSIIPALASFALRHEEDSLKEFKEGLVIFVGAAVLLFVLISIILARPIIEVTAPGLSKQQLLLALDMFTPLVTAAGLSMVSAVLLYIQYYEKSFVIPSLVALVPPVVVLMFGLAFVGSIGVRSLAFGHLCGSAVQCLILSFFAFKKNILPSLKSLLRYSEVLRAMASVPFTAASLLPLIAIPVIDRFVASALPVGSISCLGYSWALVLALAALMSRGISTVLFPVVSDVALSDIDKATRTFGEGVRFFIYVTVPISVMVSFLSTPLVNMLFSRGAFTATDAVCVAKLVLWQSVCITGVVLFIFINKIQYALQHFKTGAVLGLGFVVFYLLFSSLMAGILGVEGIAIAKSITWIGMAVILLVIVGNRAALNEIVATLGMLCRVACSAAVMWLALVLLRESVGFVAGLTWLFSVVIVGCAVYWAVSVYIFRIVLGKRIVNELSLSLRL